MLRLKKELIWSGENKIRTTEHRKALVNIWFLSAGSSSCSFETESAGSSCVSFCLTFSDQFLESDMIKIFNINTTWKMSVFRVILVRIFPYSDRIRRVSLRIRSECGKMRTRITPTIQRLFPQWNVNENKHSHCL